MKERITIRLDEDVLEWFRGSGSGYQGRINDVLRDYVRRQVGLEVPKVKTKIGDDYFRPRPKGK